MRYLLTKITVVCYLLSENRWSTLRFWHTPVNTYYDQHSKRWRFEMCRMTIKIFFLACTLRLFIIDVYATGNQNHCENVINMKVRRGISFNRANCTMVDLRETSPATNCIEVLQDLRGDALAVESRSATSWCCIFQSGLVRHLFLLIFLKIRTKISLWGSFQKTKY